MRIYFIIHTLFQSIFLLLLFSSIYYELYRILTFIIHLLILYIQIQDHKIYPLQTNSQYLFGLIVHLFF